MKFWNREKEISDLKKYLSSEPNAILFVYGPKSSGKSTLLMKVAQEMKGEPIRFLWYDLREYAIEKMEDAIAVLLGAKGTVPFLLKLFDINLYAVTVKPEEIVKVFKKELDPFVVLGRELLKIKERGMTPVIVFDEMQNFKDIYMNGERRLVDRLFNFFVAMTKVKHLAHVLVMTSDTFFIEEVYSSSALKNTSEYYLVDYFDDETALKVLIDEGLSEEDAKYVVEWIGGVPWMMERVLESGNAKGKVEEFYKQHRARLEDVLAESYKGGVYADVVHALKKALEGSLDTIKDRKMIELLAEKEVLFFDPINRTVKFQTKLDERAASEILGSSPR